VKIIKQFYPVLFLLVFQISLPNTSFSQAGSSYELLPAPDLWYNDVDGVRTGLRLRGQVPGTFNDGPHRLDFGIWLGTWIPDNPVSYYISFTEPIPGISDLGSEGNIQLTSSYRTGFQQHGIAFNKRWQQGFEEKNYKEITINFRLEDRFDSEYLLFEQLWSEENLVLAGLNFNLRDENAVGRYLVESRNSVNIAGQGSSFISSTLDLQQFVPLNDNFSFRIRTFLGVSSNDAPAQYLYSASFKPSRRWMDSGLTRAKGTIPTPWMEEGIFQVAGGANLRGYLDQDFDRLNEGLNPVFNSFGAINVEFDYPNPIDRSIQNIPVIGGLLEFRSYLFFDTGTSLGITEREEDRVLSDAGPGFMVSVNIPDYLGKNRGIMIRYDIPLWLSNPDDNNHFEYRNVIGIGAVIDL